jgi:hypothetical protein
MKLRCSIPLLAMILALVLTAGGDLAVRAQESAVDCAGFASFEEANAYLTAHPDTEALLDDDGDGTACEAYFRLERGNDRTEDRTRRGTNRNLRLAQEATEAEDLDCEDFNTQEEAQATLDADATDPNNLDPNGDGIACALLPSAADLQPADVGAATAEETAGSTSTTSAQTTEEGNQTREERRQARQQERNQEGNQDQNQNQEGTEEVVAVSCADYATAEEAQAAFDADPEAFAALDPDGNGIACEELIQAEPGPEQTREERRANRRNRDNQEEPAPEATIDEPAPVQVQEDIDCADFDFQEEAQAVYNQDPSDPYNLDPSGDGFACSSLPLSTPVVTQVPRTGVGLPIERMFSFLATGSVLLSAAAGSAAWRMRSIRKRAGDQ